MPESSRRQERRNRRERSWKSLRVPELRQLPRDVVVRSEQLPPRHAFPEHRHAWNQLVYALSGVLVVTVEQRWFVVPPQQAVWIPTGTAHRVGTWFGAEFRSLYVSQQGGAGMPDSCSVLEVTPLLRALIIETLELDRRGDDENYVGRIEQLTLDQLRRLPAVRFHLPWPQGPMLQTLCESLYAQPGDPRGIEQWGDALGASARTLSRHFVRETGLSFRDWRHRLRLFKAVELLGAGRSVTDTALELGYSTTSSFCYMFRTGMGASPKTFRQPAALSATPAPAPPLVRRGWHRPVGARES